MDINERQRLLQNLIAHGVLSISPTGVPSIADKDSTASVWIARTMLEQVSSLEPRLKLKGQAAGNLFEQGVGDYIEAVFPKLALVRCGNFVVGRKRRVSDFDQYEHLAEIVRLAGERREIKIAFGMDYIIQPDVVIYREPTSVHDVGLADAESEARGARHTPLLKENAVRPTLHASVSCKFTLRSDRAQNARSEALNLIRNRKGKLPHIALVTAEPTAGRISSLALGTGDIDFVYHIALPELHEATRRYASFASGAATKGAAAGLELLETLIEGRRLRDIADLPFDLAI
jgi:hypothetical protein